MNIKRLRIAKKNDGYGPGWLTTFNDLVTLLMVFFLLLFAMGSMDNPKLKNFQYALQSGLGILEEGSQVSIAVKDSRQDPDKVEILAQAEGELDAVDKEEPANPIDEALNDLTAEPGIDVRYSKQGAHITFDDFLLFDFGKADINPDGFAFLEKLATLIHKIPNSVRVEGHTDNIPINTAHFPSNWELSIARAVNVVKYFAGTGKINPQRLSAVGYGDARPLVANDSPLHRTRNRRVEIVIATEG